MTSIIKCIFSITFSFHIILHLELHCLFITFNNNYLFCIIFRHIKDSHIKTKLVHILYQIQKYGVMPIKEFKELLNDFEYTKCQQNLKKTWYSMSLKVFTSFIFQVCLVKCSSFFSFLDEASLMSSTLFFHS